MTALRRLPLLFALLTAACMPQDGMLSSGLQREPDPFVLSLSEPNRLDKALAASSRGWKFSALFAAGDKRVPLLILVRARAPQAGQTTQTEPELQAMLLTETSLGLCSLEITPTAVTVRSLLPDDRITTLCERVGTALRHLVLAPLPDGREALLSMTDPDAATLADPTDRTPKTVLWRKAGRDKVAFSFLRNGPLTEKRTVKNDTLLWRAAYSEHRPEQDAGQSPYHAAPKEAVYIPRNWRYVEAFWNLRMVMLSPEG